MSSRVQITKGVRTEVLVGLIIVFQVLQSLQVPAFEQGNSVRSRLFRFVPQCRAMSSVQDQGEERQSIEGNKQRESSASPKHDFHAYPLFLGQVSRIRFILSRSLIWDRVSFSAKFCREPRPFGTRSYALSPGRRQVAENRDVT